MEQKNTANFLIVDDQSTMRMVMKRSLYSMGYENVADAGDGNMALQYLSENSVDYIICDWNMPKLDGLGLLEYIRGNEKYRAIPFMMVTAEADRQKVQAALAAGANEFLVKPFTPATLNQKVTQLMRQGRKTPTADIQQKSLAEPKPVPSVKSAPDKKTILVVDDTATNIEMITGILSGDYHLIAATNGEKALQLASKDPAPDLILLDVMMPGMDGLAVCRELKSETKTQNIPVIFLSSKDDVDDVAAGFDAGAVDYVSKPAHHKILKARIKTQLSLKQANDDLLLQLDTLIENARLREDVERMTQHDLKSPLTAIIHTTELLLDGKTNEGDHTSDIENIRSSAYTILKMIDLTLDLYKMETGQYQLKAENIDIIPVLRSVAYDARASAETLNVSIDIKSPASCSTKGEELLIFSMMGNLIKNAIEASPKNDIVTVSVDCGKVLTISVHNQGVIPEEIRETFFDRYVSHGKKSGTGLGTYSAKLMAQVQNGDITFETSESKGTTLKVTLPQA